jgi:hypothetical protein
MFCMKAGVPFTFRPPTEADYLASESRRRFLVPRHEVDLGPFRQERAGEASMLTQQTRSTLKKWQRRSAVGHWKIMRGVLPAGVWESW